MKALHKNFTIIIALLILLSNCNPKNNDSAVVEVDDNDVVEIVTSVMDFQLVDSIPSGWTTFRYINNSAEPHFFLLEKYPEGKTIDDGKKDVFPVFQKGMDFINKGNAADGFAEFANLPEWFPKIVFSGGSGLVSPKNSSLTTIQLDPGYYVIECYVKMENGTFHSAMGMSKALVVTNETNTNQPPATVSKVTISSTKGFTFNQPIQKGKQTFSVFFEDQILHENSVGHDLNIVKLEDGVNLEILESWMNWANPIGLISPAPQGVTFLGGVNDMPAGSTGYFEVTLEPGSYAFVSEVPNTRSKNLLITFTVAE